MQNVSKVFVHSGIQFSWCVRETKYLLVPPSAFEKRNLGTRRNYSLQQIFANHKISDEPQSFYIQLVSLSFGEVLHINVSYTFILLLLR